MKTVFEAMGVLTFFALVLYMIIWIIPMKSDLEIKDNRICQELGEAFSFDSTEKCFEIKIVVNNY